MQRPKRQSYFLLDHRGFWLIREVFLGKIEFVGIYDVFDVFPDFLVIIFIFVLNVLVLQSLQGFSAARVLNGSPINFISDEELLAFRRETIPTRDSITHSLKLNGNGQQLQKKRHDKKEDAVFLELLYSQVESCRNSQ